MEDLVTKAPAYVSNRFARLSKSAQTGWDNLGTWDIAAFFLLYLLFVGISSGEPGDGDVFRHMKSYLYGYDYRAMYPDGTYPPFNPYIGANWFMGLAHRGLGYLGFVPLQMVSLALLAVSYLWGVREAPPQNRFFGLCLLMAFMTQRYLFARPSLYLTSLMMLGIAWSRDPRIKAWCHMALGLVMASMYYLFWIYLLPLVFLRRAYLVPLAAGVLGWHLYGEGAYWQVMADVLFDKCQSLVPYAEVVTPALPGILKYSVVILPFLLYWKKDIKVSGVVAWFLLPNQIRYEEALVPLAATFWRHWGGRVPLSVGMAAFAFMLFSVPSPSRPGYKLGQHLKAFGGEKHILALTIDTAMRATAATGKIHVAPGFAASWEHPDIQALNELAVNKGLFDCEKARRLGYDLVVENRLSAIPSCLALVDVVDNYRIWDIKKQEK